MREVGQIRVANSTDRRLRFNRYFASLLLPWNWGMRIRVRFRTWRRSVREFPRSRRRSDGSDSVTVVALSMMFCSGAHR